MDQNADALGLHALDDLVAVGYAHRVGLEHVRAVAFGDGRDDLLERL